MCAHACKQLIGFGFSEAFASTGHTNAPPLHVASICTESKAPKACNYCIQKLLHALLRAQCRCQLVNVPSCFKLIAITEIDLTQVVRRRELQLVQNQHLLRDPEVELFAEALEPT